MIPLSIVYGLHSLPVSTPYTSLSEYSCLLLRFPFYDPQQIEKKARDIKRDDMS